MNILIRERENPKTYNTNNTANFKFSEMIHEKFANKLYN